MGLSTLKQIWVKFSIKFQRNKKLKWNVQTAEIVPFGISDLSFLTLTSQEVSGTIRVKQKKDEKRVSLPSYSPCPKSLAK